MLSPQNLEAVVSNPAIQPAALREVMTATRLPMRLYSRRPSRETGISTSSLMRRQSKGESWYERRPYQTQLAVTTPAASPQSGRGNDVQSAIELGVQQEQRSGGVNSVYSAVSKGNWAAPFHFCDEPQTAGYELKALDNRLHFRPVRGGNKFGEVRPSHQAHERNEIPAPPAISRQNHHFLGPVRRRSSS